MDALKNRCRVIRQARDLDGVKPGGSGLTKGKQLLPSGLLKRKQHAGDGIDPACSGRDRCVARSRPASCRRCCADPHQLRIPPCPSPIGVRRTMLPAIHAIGTTQPYSDLQQA